MVTDKCCNSTVLSESGSRGFEVEWKQVRFEPGHCNRPSN